MPWLLAVPGHQQIRYWLYEMGRSPSAMMKDSNHLDHLSIEKCKCIFYEISVQRNEINGLVQDCSISSANALEILQSCTKPSIWNITKHLSSSKKNHPIRIRFPVPQGSVQIRRCYLCPRWWWGWPKCNRCFPGWYSHHTVDCGNEFYGASLMMAIHAPALPDPAGDKKIHRLVSCLVNVFNTLWEVV